MAVSGKTARRLLKFLLTTDPPSFHENLELLCNQLDNDVEILTGKLSERSVAKLFGRLFYVQGDATEANNGIVWIDLGATWVALNGGLTDKNIAAGRALTATGNSYSVNKVFSKAEAEAGVEPSATRMAIVRFTVVPTGLSVGGISLTGSLGPGEGPVHVPPTQKWKATVAVEANTLLL